MKLPSLLSLSALALLLGATPPRTLSPAEAQIQLGVDLLRSSEDSATSRPANSILSPASIQAALSMTAAGARGATAQEFQTVLHGSLDRAWHEATGSLTKRLLESSAQGGPEFRLANRLWLQTGEKLQPAFAGTLEQSYAAPVARWDFARQSEAGRQDINSWVKNTTKGKIPELLAQGGVSPATTMVLVNALYLNAPWQSPFDPKRTQTGTFLLAGNKTTRAPFMRQTAPMGWHQGKGFQAIELPFAGDELTLLVVLPEKADGLPALMEKLTASSFDQIVNNMTEQSIDLSLPKFTARKSFSLKPALTRLGLASAFGAQANFSGMLQSRGKSSSSLSIDDVIHEAVLEVSERGAEGAAATAVVMMRSAMPVKPRVVRVDRPFLFAVRDRAQGGMLFLGTVANPM